MLSEMLGREPGEGPETLSRLLHEVSEGTEEVYFNGHPVKARLIAGEVDWLYRLLSAAHGLINARAKGTPMERDLLILIRRAVPGLAERIATEGAPFVDLSPVPGPTPNPPSEGFR